MKKSIKLIVLALILIVGLSIGKYAYDYKEVIDNQEQKNVKIDEYNFKQLEKVKNILKDLKRTDIKFSSLKEFNHIYNSNIEPIKNCYYINKYNNEDRVLYNFGFKLESNKYIKKYGTKNYMYPKYDLPIEYFCGGSKNCKDDINLNYFIYKITNPCED